MSDQEPIEVQGQEVTPGLPAPGDWVIFLPPPNDPPFGLYPGVWHLGLVIGTTKGRPIFRIFSPTGRDATFTYTGSEGTWKPKGSA